ncbi:MAG: hypothetical protein IPL61_29140 [Myxococcales bacterium]|nr:hypothetical protein [Myxococcales bacterium]
MCWSAEVSAAFAVAEWAGVAWLWRRDRPLDRPFAIAVSPIAAQEAVQWLLWEHIAVRADACDRVNVIASLVVRLLIGLVPLAWVWFAQRGSPRPRLARAFLVTTLGFVVVRAALIVGAFAAGPARCTVIGPNHHQAWASFLAHYAGLQPALDVVFFTLYWALPVGALVLLFRPRWLGLLLTAIIVGTLATTMALLALEEFGSMWCWSSAALIVVALATGARGRRGTTARR